MEDYMRQMRENSSRGSRGLYGGGGDGGGGGTAAAGAPAATTNSSSSCCSFLYANNNHNHGGGSSSSNEAIHHHDQFQHVKIEAGLNPAQLFHYPPPAPPQPPPPPPPPPSSIISNNNNNLLHLQDANYGSTIKARIISHPHYSNLLQAYMDCQKVGAPPEVVARLTALRQEYEAKQRASSITTTTDSNSSRQDPELDQFMEAYYDMLVKYREELTRPLQEAMEFMRRIEAQLATLSTSDVHPIFDPRTHTRPDEKSEVNGSSEEEQENSGGETEVVPEVDPRAEDRELKNHLLRRYSGYLASLKQELSKKKKKGKLPKDARQKLLSWWELHYKWPYPSESEKVALAESTGLDQKQINNWFINQRKRHWKPSEDMQFMVMDGLHPQNAAAALFMEAHYMGVDGPYRFGT